MAEEKKELDEEARRLQALALLKQALDLMGIVVKPEEPIELCMRIRTDVAANLSIIAMRVDRPPALYVDMHVDLPPGVR